MDLRNIIITCLVILLTGSCKSVEFQSGLDGVKVEILDQNPEKIILKIVNSSEYSVAVESTQHLYLQRKVDDGWERVAYIPCACGTPCMEPRPKPIELGEKMEVTWDYISRGCTSGMPPETKESRVETGSYRLTFTLNPSKEGKRLNPEKLTVDFKVR